MKFKEIIREKREQLGLRLVDVGDKVAINKVTVCDYEFGRSYPTNAKLRQLCDVLKLDFNSMHELITQEKEQAEIEKAQQRIDALQRVKGKGLEISSSIRQMMDFVKVLLEQEKQSAGLVRQAAPPVNIDPQRSVPALVLKTIEQTFVQVTDGPFFYPDGRLSLDIRIPAADLPVEPEQEVKVDLLFLPIGEIVHTFTLSPAGEQRVEVELPTEHPELKDLLRELQEGAIGPMRLPLATVSFRIR